MATQQQFTKGCLHSTHNAKETLFICSQQDCDNKSRLVCLQCIQKGTHTHYDHFLQINEIENHENILIENWPKNPAIRDIYQSANSEGNSQMQEIENFLDAMVENFATTIRLMKKDIKVRVLEQKYKMKDVIVKFKEDIDNAFDLGPLKQYVQDFRESKADMHTLHQNVAAFSRKQERLNQQTSIIKSYKEVQKEINVGKVDMKALTNFEEGISNLLEQFPKQILRNGGYSAFRFEPIPGCNQIEVVDECIIKGKGSGQYDNARSKETFSKNDHINFSFKINKHQEQSGYFFFGVAPKNQTDTMNYFWFSNGVQLCIRNNNQQSGGSFQKKGKKMLNAVYKLGQQYDVEVCVKDNLFRIQDIDQQCKMEFSGSFQKNHEDWVIVIGSNQTQPQGWEIEFL